MQDFYQIKERIPATKKDTLEIYPDFIVKRSQDLMIRGKAFYAIWDEKAGMWSDNEYDIQRLVDEALKEYEVKTPGIFEVHRKYLGNFSTKTWLEFRNYVGHLSDNFHELNSRVVFANTEVRKEDYVSRRLPYDLIEGDISAWDELVSVLYDPEERAKIEWAIGAIITGDSTTIQKFLALYGAPGSGKSTILNIIQWLFEGYWTAFVAKELVGSNNSFALEAFKTNPLLAIDHDADMSKAQDNSKINALVAHEPMEINEKNKPKWMTRFNAMIMVASNSPVKITDSRSGLIRRMIDIHPSGRTLSNRRYQTLMNQVHFELGAIAHHCREVYLSMGKDYYSGYKPIEMMLQTDVFFNFIESYYDIFSETDGVTLNQAFEMYKTFIKDSEIEYSLPRYKLREELKSYFNNFEDRAIVNGERVRSWYSGFNADRFKAPTGAPTEQHMYSLVMDEKESLLDRELADFPAQYANAEGNPILYWDDSERQRLDRKTNEMVTFNPKPSEIVSTKLKDLDTTKEHYVKVPHNLIVIDFDLKDKDGKKSAERNLEAASSWPSTYAEFSKSGAGIHLHYYYTGDPSELASNYDDGIEVKVYSGNSALRRMRTACNNVPISKISSGLPLKEKKLIDHDQVKSEKALRDLIKRNLKKEIHPGTKPSMDFIHHILEEAYGSGLSYDVSDMHAMLFAFATNSTNHGLYCIKLLQTMKLKSEDVIEAKQRLPKDEREVIFDVEVFPNLFVVCWKYKGSPKSSIVALINPSAVEIEKLLAMKLVGFNVRRYDNHILYGAFMGFDNAGLYNLSRKIIDKVPNAFFAQAYNISYTDIYDFASKKQSLKKWEIELGIHHMELGLPWDEPVPEELWPKVVEYCKNDVEATEAVRNHLEADFIARQILADLSGLSMNATTQQHASKIVFGEDKNPQNKFVYSDLSDLFPGYIYDRGTSTYRGIITGEGGYVYAEPGMYENVALLDVASMHPTSIEQLDLFGEYTENFAALKRARIAIKKRDYETAKAMFGGKLGRHLNDPNQAAALSYALKIVINIVYGLTSASFENSFKDPRNVDNIVAKRGALFMIDLKYEVESRGFTVAHIKTDSIKIPNATPEIIDFVFEFGRKYGYDFEHETTYEKFCLVNDAVYIAKDRDQDDNVHWTAVGAQFQHPYVYKTLFTHEPITFEDMCEARSVVKSAMYIDFTGLSDTPMAFYNVDEKEMLFVGKTGLFCPMQPGTGGGFLVREKDDKFYAVTGTKGYFWLEAEMVKALGKEQAIDRSYFDALATAAREHINQYGDFDSFVS